MNTLIKDSIIHIVNKKSLFGAIVLDDLYYYPRNVLSKKLSERLSSDKLMILKNSIYINLRRLRGQGILK